MPIAHLGDASDCGVGFTGWSVGIPRSVVQAHDGIVPSEHWMALEVLGYPTLTISAAMPATIR